MNKKIFTIVILTLIFIGIVIWWIFGGLIKFLSPGQKEKAINVAQSYVQTEFKQQMVYLEVTKILEPLVYEVYFSPENNTDLVFSVQVSPELTINSDNYYLRYFECEMAKLFNKKVKTIWGSEASIYVHMSTKPISYYNITDLSEKTKLEDIKHYLREYYFSINIEKVYKADDKQAEAERIFKLIKTVQNSDYKPYEILFWYSDPEQKGESHLFVDKWNKITKIEQVIETLDTNWIN